jgi:MFS family permease
MTDRVHQSSSQSATAVRQSNERCGIREGAYTAIMQGVGENYFTAFALLLRATAAQVGLLAALPAFIGTVAQLASVFWLRSFDRRHRIVVVTAVLQALLWLPLLGLPLLFPAYGVPLLIACAIPFVVAGHFAIPAWNSLITDLIDPGRRGAYFAYRARVMSVTSFASVIVAGLILTWTAQHHQAWAGIAGIFLAAACARGMAAFYLQRLDEANVPGMKERHLVFKDFTDREHRPFRKFLLFSGAVQFAAMVAGPYIGVYILRDLGFSYFLYSAWAGASIIGGYLTLNGWGRIGDSYGNKKLLLASGMGLPVIPALYLLTTNSGWIILINGLAGIMWSGFHLGLQNIVYDMEASHARAGAVAISNGVNAGGAFLGTMAGGWLSSDAPTAFEIAGLSVHLTSNLPLVFAASTVCLSGSLFLIRALKEARIVEPISHHALFLELPLIKPMMDVLGARTGHQP